MGLNAGGVNTVPFLRHGSNVPAAVGQLVESGGNYYVLLSVGGRNSTTGEPDVTVRQITNTGLAAATQIALDDVAVENNPTTINSITIA